MNNTKSYDILILGGGLSGLFAAVRAAECGAGSIGIFEAGVTLGGNGRMASTFVSSDFSDYGNYDSDENAEKLYRRAMTTLEGTGNPELIYRYLYHTRDIAKWCEERGLNQRWRPVTFGPFKSNCSRNVEFEEETRSSERIGNGVIKLLIAELDKYPNITVHLKSRAKELLTDKSGTVTGALIQTADGFVAVNAKRVILACGGVGGSARSLAKYLPEVVSPEDDIRPDGVGTCLGDGVEMARALGAEVGLHMNIHLLGPGYLGNRNSKLGHCMDSPYAIYLSKDGKRFVDETTRFGQDLVKNLPGRVYYAVFGQKSMETAWTAPKEPMGPPPGGDGAPGPDMDEMPPMKLPPMEDVPFSQIRTAFPQDLRKGAFKVADTLEELADFLGAKPEVLKNTLERFNQDCKNGVDTQLRKNAKYLIPVEGPYYALYAVRSLDSTQGGITVNPALQALKPDGTVIPGMYVTGDHVTGFVSELYGPGGAGMTFAMVSGYLAGEAAAHA